jgi:hypothetical protein
VLCYHEYGGRDAVVSCAGAGGSDVAQASQDGGINESLYLSVHTLG